MNEWTRKQETTTWDIIIIMLECAAASLSCRVVMRALLPMDEKVRFRLQLVFSQKESKDSFLRLSRLLIVRMFAKMCPPNLVNNHKANERAPMLMQHK